MKQQKNLTVSQNSLYNTVGSIFYCVCQWVISALLVVHLSPKSMSVQNAGMLQLAISVTNIFNAIGLYSLRTYQISDVKNQYSNGDYIGVRFITSAISVVSCVAYTAVLGYSFKNVSCITFYMIYKLSEIFSDVLHGIDQKNRRMDYVGISYVLRGIVGIIAFAATLLITGNIVISTAVLAVATILVVVFYDCSCTTQFGSIKPIFNRQVITTLLITCLPAVISTAAFTAIVSIPRQMLERSYGEETLGYYGTISTPLIVVQVMATSIFYPMFTELAQFYEEGKTKAFAKQIMKNLIILAGISLVVCLCVMLFGEFAVSLVFGQAFKPYTHLMYGIVGCTTMYVLSWLCTNILIIVRKLNTCMITSLLALGVSCLTAMPLIKTFGMNGVSFAVMIAYAIHIVVCVIIIIKILRKKQSKTQNR